MERYCPHCGEKLREKRNGLGQVMYYQCPTCGMASNDENAIGSKPDVVQHPDPWMDNEPGTLTLPEHWAGWGEAPVPGQAYRVGELPPGSVVQTSTGSEYVVSRTGLAMKWEQPIPGSEDWKVTYLYRLPSGEWMTDKMWKEVAATGAEPEVNEKMFKHPDPWMDNEPGTLTLPTQWGPPPRESTVGPVEVSWDEIDPGVALVRVHGGTLDDRTLVHDLWRVQLASCGIEHAQFHVGDDDEFRKTAHWRDLMAKAKRLIDSGNVKIMTNFPHVVAAHVVGDHGEYNCEFKRDDPDSWSITGWDCECPWSQYAWQRTRKWKKYEGRVCSHVLAAFWFSRRHALDGLSPDQGPNTPIPMGMKGPEGTPPPEGGGLAPGGPEGAPGAPQQQFGPEDQPGQLFGLQDGGPGQFTQPIQPGPEAMPGTMPGGATMPDSGAPPGNGVIPPQPMLAQPLPPYIPGSTPNGLPAPPNAVSVPGVRPQSPANPGQYPGDGTGTGGTFSKVAGYPRYLFHATDAMPDLIDEHGLLADPSPVDPNFEGHGGPSGERFCEPGVYMAAPEDLHRHWADPYSSIFRVDTSHLDPNLLGPDPNHPGAWVYKGDVPPHAVENFGPLDGNQEHQARTAAQAFENGAKVKLLKPEWGITEGKSEAHGAGQYQEVAAGRLGEVMGQDKLTGWVEVIFDLESSGPLEPYHVRCFLEPSNLQIVAYPPGSPFIKRVGPHTS